MLPGANFIRKWRGTLSDLAELAKPNAKVLAGYEADAPSSSVISQAPPILLTWHDLRDEPRTKRRGKRARVRPVEQVTGIVLHQTAVRFGNDPFRMLNVPVHSGVLDDGNIVLLHRATDYMFHAHALNRFTIGIEISCRAAGIEGEHKTFWRSKKEKKRGREYGQLVSEANERQILGARQLLKFYKERYPNITKIYAHRQGHKSRVSDPGDRIWREVAHYGADILGFELPESETYGSGKPIPTAWSPVLQRENVCVRYSGRVRGC